jgi:hypothetical protein
MLTECVSSKETARTMIENHLLAQKKQKEEEAELEQQVI